MVINFDKKRKRFKFKITMFELITFISSIKALVAFFYYTKEKYEFKI